jgi:RAT1-interacting protein
MEFDKPSQNSLQKTIESSYYGFRFETISTVNKISGLRDKITNNSVEWIHIYSSSIDELSLVYAAEIDAIDDKSNELVELKTHKIPRNDRDEYFFRRRKMMHTWAQSYLGNVQKIVFGFRDENGFIVDYERRDLNELPVIAKETGWEPSEMISFLKEYLCKVKCIVSMQPGKVFRIELNPNRRSTNPIITETTLPLFVQL